MTTQYDNDTGEWLIPKTVRHYKAIAVDKAHQTHSIKILPPGYIERDDNTE